MKKGRTAMSTQHLENAGATDGSREEITGRMVFEPEESAQTPEGSWESLASLALDEAPFKRSLSRRALDLLRKPTVLLSIAVVALAYPAYKGISASTPLPNFPGRDHREAVPAQSTTVLLTANADPSKAVEATIRESKPVLEVILVGPKDLDLSKKWKVTVQHPGREIWQSKWARQFELVKGEPRLAFELDGRNLPEGPLSIVIKESKPKGVEGAQDIYRLRVKKR
jgi:hypothetical protein